MVFDVVEILAIILIVLALIKMIVILISAKAWMKFAKWIYSNTFVIRLILFVLAAIVLYYLINAGISIVTIFAVAVFVALLFAMAIAPYAKDLFKIFKLKDLWLKQWFYVLIWLCLMAWAVIELFF